MKAINKAIKIIITIILAIGLLIGFFYGILYLDATFKKMENGEYFFKESETHELFASKHGYYLPTNSVKQGYEEEVYYGTNWKLKNEVKVNVCNVIHFNYYNTTKDENGFEKYTYDRLNNGIYSLRIEVITKPVITWAQEVFRERDMKRNSPRHSADKFSYIKTEIAGADSMGYISVNKNYQFDEYELRMYMESRISKECHVKASVNWIIDINNYNYDAMTQTALDYMAYIINNVQPPIS